MVLLKQDAQGVYQTNILAENKLTGQRERVCIKRSTKHKKLWDLYPLVEKLDTKSECKNELSRIIKKSKIYDDWALMYDPNYNYVK